MQVCPPNAPQGPVAQPVINATKGSQRIGVSYTVLMRWGLLLLIFSACNSEPLDLPERPMSKVSPEALVACGVMTCGRGQACCTHDDGIGGNCYGLDANDRCYSFFACDGAEDCLD